MLKKRIIPCLDIKNGRTVKGVNFKSLIDLGSPIELAKQYEALQADELVLLDITASIENRSTFTELVEQISKEISIPFTIGGGISSIQDVERLLKVGADKVSINSAAVKNPNLINELVKEFGSQCIVVAIDTNLVNSNWKVFVKGGNEETDLTCLDWAKEITDRGAGEILLTSMAADGTKSGFSNSITAQVSESCNIPVIASGGAGIKEHFVDVFTIGKADAALAASIFHTNELPIPELKNYLRTQKIAVR